MEGEILDATPPFNIKQEFGRLVTDSNGLTGFFSNKKRMKKIPKPKKPRTPTEPVIIIF